MRQAIFVGLASLATLLLGGCGGSVDEPSARVESPQVWMPTAPTPLPKPHTCVAYSVMWTTDGGWYPSPRESSTITGCRTYEHVYYPDGASAPPARCSVELTAAGEVSLEDLNAVMDASEVVSAFRRAGPIGETRAGRDGADDLVMLHGGRLIIGSAAPRPLERLVEILASIDQKECPRVK